MKIEEKVEIKSKGQVVATKDYEFPETLEEALDVDGEEKVYSLYAQQRKIRWMDAARREATGGGLPSAITKALKGKSPEDLLKIAEALGLDLSDL